MFIGSLSSSLKSKLIMSLKKKIATFKELLSNGWCLIADSEKKSIWGLAIFSCLVNVFDTFSITTVMPLVAVVIDPTLIQKNKILNQIHAYFGVIEIKHFIFMLVLIAIIFIIVSLILKLWLHLLIRKFGLKCQERLARDFMTATINAPLLWHYENSSARLAHLAHTDIMIWSDNYLQRIINLPSYIFMGILSVILVLLIAPGMGIIGVVSFATLSLIGISLVKAKLTELPKLKRDHSNDTHSLSTQIYSGIREIKVYQCESFFKDQYLKKFHLFGNSLVDYKFYQKFPNNLIQLTGQIGLIIMTLFIWNTGISGGELAAKVAMIVMITSRLIPNITNITNEVSSLYGSIPHVNGIITTLKQAKPIQYKGEVVTYNKDWTRLNFVDISFDYPSRKGVLKNINLTIEKNKSYGLIGRSGSGKSTILNLLLGLIEPTHGNILLDDVNLGHLSKNDWLTNIGYVAQSPYFFIGSVLDNLLMGKNLENVTSQEIDEALRKADLLETVREMPMGVNSSIGDRGAKLSGGQLQRLGIARALLHKPKILVLDEATSSLDVFSENEILKTISKLKNEITVIIIAHRLSTIQNCDQIYILDEGKILEQGSYEDLSTNSLYFQKMKSISTQVQNIS